MNIKRGMVWQNAIVWWIIAILVLALSLILYGIISGKLGGIANYLKDFLKVGGQ